MPPPISQTTTPIWRSVSESTTSAEASGLSTNWVTSTPEAGNDLAQVFHRGGRGGDDVGFHFQAVAVHADRHADAILSIHDKAALDDVNDLAVVGDGDGLGGIQGAGHVILRR